VILLDEKGKEFTSREFAQKLNYYQNNSIKKVCFLIGGAMVFLMKCTTEPPKNCLFLK
jgi:23S rRNA (pseudouridine1915-N3)-methyltransferase